MLQGRLELQDLSLEGGGVAVLVLLHRAHAPVGMARLKSGEASWEAMRDIHNYRWREVFLPWELSQLVEQKPDAEGCYPQNPLESASTNKNKMLPVLRVTLAFSQPVPCKCGGC